MSHHGSSCTPQKTNQQRLWVNAVGKPGYKRMVVLSALCLSSRHKLKQIAIRILATLFRRSNSSNIVVVAVGSNTRVGKLGGSGVCLRGRWGLRTEQIDNAERLMQLCTERHLFLSSRNFQHSSNSTATFQSNSTGTLSQTDHLAVNYRWRGSLRNCRFYWSSYLQSKHALVLMRFLPQQIARPVDRRICLLRLFQTVMNRNHHTS